VEMYISTQAHMEQGNPAEICQFQALKLTTKYLLYCNRISGMQTHRYGQDKVQLKENVLGV